MALEKAGIGSGALLPYEVLVRGDRAGQGGSGRGPVEGIHGAVAPALASWRSAGTSLVEAFPIPDGSSPEARDLVGKVRVAAHAEGPDVRVGGQPAQNHDFIYAVYGNFPLMIALIAVFTFILLARAFRSLLLPLKAVILNVISVGAAWGVMALDLAGGPRLAGDLGDRRRPGAIDSWIPLMVFAFLFGLSMDYEVFILARMREEYDATGDTDVAVVRGIGRTGGWSPARR